MDLQETKERMLGMVLVNYNGSVETAVRRLLPPDNESISKLAREPI
jgi:hypothetical protein